MAGQQQQIIDTIFSMKKKLLRKDDSDTEEADSSFGSNKQNLKRKVQYARGSDPDFLLDPRPYKKRIEHAGYTRYILQCNPPRYDPDGDVVEQEDDYDDEDDVEAVEENPYEHIRLENILAPLTSAGDLPTHPALSVAYTSRHLTDLVNEAGALSRKEQATVARAKALYVKLQGDTTFAPAALAAMGNVSLNDRWTNGTLQPAADDEAERSRHAEMPDSVEDAPDMDLDNAVRTNGVSHENGSIGGAQTEAVDGVELAANDLPQDGEDMDKLLENGDAADDASDTASQQTAHRMTTRARAQAASTPSPPPSPSSGLNPIHPLFSFSAESLPDRDLGLPPNEAEETRMIVMAYMQKQGEVARATADLYHGLLQADRMRHDVFKWSKAEAHLGEMSDGEDWYDNEEWGLEQDLVKGRDEEDDETAVAGKKSTRQRRKPDKEDR